LEKEKHTNALKLSVCVRDMENFPLINLENLNG
jgi:hypothetical protein